MIVLYKNIDINDLESILEKGILSANNSKNYNWEDGNRADNPMDVVYMYEPIKCNSMVNYGIVVLGCLLKRDEVEKKQMEDNDANKGVYEEYVIKQVSPSSIIRILIPKIFKEKIERNYPFIKKLDVQWCNLSGKVWDDSINGKRVASEEDFEYLRDMPLNTYEYCYMRGIDKKGRVVDYYDICYSLD